MDSLNYIDGIFNFCDRWCEKCDFTTKCRVFKIEEDKNETENNPDEVFEDIAETLKDTFNMLTSILEEQGVDVNQIIEEADNKEFAVIETKHENAKSKDYCIFSLDYSSKVDSLLEILKKTFSKKVDIINKKFDLGLDFKVNEDEYNIIDQHVEIILYYQYLIYIKLLRATEEKIFDNELEEFSINFYEGTAKVAIISIEKSINSWNSLISLVPEIQDEIIGVLALLQKILNLVNIEFPTAKDFIRPGFDEIN